MRIFEFISKRLADAETRYSTTEREALAVVRCLEEVRWLISGSEYPTFVYTDHSALVNLLKHDDAHGRLGKWQVKLSACDLQYIHIPGTQNVIADGLSRIPSRYFDEEQEVMEVAAVVEEVRDWSRWKESAWYGMVVEVLLSGGRKSEEEDQREWRLARLKGRRYRLYDGRIKGLFYMERNGKLARCIEEEEVKQELQRHHDCHGHFAGKMLLSRLIGKVHWPTRATDAHYYAQTCHACQVFGPIKPSAGIKPVVYLQPMDMVRMDFIGPITPTSGHGNRYIIIMVDYFSRYLFAKAVKGPTVEAAWDLLLTAMNHLGNPVAVYTDNGSHFTGEAFQNELAIRGIKHFPVPMTHPQSVGLSERYVQLLMKTVKRFSFQAGRHRWDDYVSIATRALNTRIVRVHGYTPAELIFEFVPRGMREYRVEELCILEGLDEDGCGLRLAMLDENREKAGEKMIKAADAVEAVSKGAWTALQEGDLVLLRKFQRSSKLKPTWEGP